MKPKKVSLKSTTPTAPRQMSEINQEYNQLCGQIGQARYQIQVVDTNIRNWLERMKEINVEASQRNALDLEAKKAQESSEESSNVQAR